MIISEYEKNQRDIAEIDNQLSALKDKEPLIFHRLSHRWARMQYKRG